MLAIYSGSEGVSSFLISHPDIDLTIPDADGHLALYYGYRYGLPKEDLALLKKKTQEQLDNLRVKKITSHNNQMTPDNQKTIV